jgi:chromosome segregation protein
VDPSEGHRRGCERPAGYEAALGAALADDLNAPTAAKAGESGWSALPGYDDAAPLPAVAEPLARS